MKKLMILAVALALLSPAINAQARDVTETEMFYDFLAGNYWLVGKALDSQDSFVGRVKLVSQGNSLKVTRIINGVQTIGEARIEPTGLDGGQVLRLRFVEHGMAHEGTYLWQSDADNYARLTGYVYRPDQLTTSPGMEALFIAHEE